MTIKSSFQLPTQAGDEISGTIFILDDQIEIATSLASILDYYKYNVSFFTQPEDLLDALAKQDHPDLILSDIKMPEKNGLDLLKEIRSKKITVPIAFISGFMNKEIILEALQFGIAGFIEKPFNESELITIVHNIIQKNKAFNLLNRSINCLYYQFRELDNYLVDNNNIPLRDLLKTELETLIRQRNTLNNFI